MKRDIVKSVRIVEILKSTMALPTLRYGYVSDSYYDVSVTHHSKSWVIKLTHKPFETPLEKAFEEKLFEEHVNEPRVFVAEVKGKRVGWLELGYDKWNNRMRVWQLAVEERFRRKGLGTLLMSHGAKIAKERGARMLVLETQSCNIPAINFYVKYGFAFIGLDITAYSNMDAERKEVRLEFGLKL